MTSTVSPDLAESTDFEDTSENVLAKLCQEAPNITIRNLLRFYNTKKSTKDIRAKMNSCSKDDLVMALDYLGVSNQNIYLKESVTHNLICRIENLLPDKCGICEQIYCINKDEPTFLPCKKCGQEAHRECYQSILSSNNIEDIPAIIAAIPGIHYLCPTCEQVTIPEQGTLLKSIQKKRGTAEEPVSKSTKPAAEGLPILNDQCRNNNDDNNDESIHSSQPPPSSTGSPLNEAVEVIEAVKDQNKKSTLTLNNSSESKNNGQSQNLPICRTFLKGTCKHGMSGKSNDGCQYRHLKTCNKILKHGIQGKYGCNKGKKCEHFHPKMCSSSLVKSVCYDPEYKFNHVKGTKRIQQKPPDHNNTKEFPPLQASQHVVNHPNYNLTQPTSLSANVASNVIKQNQNMDFLSMMRSMKEEIMRALDMKLTSL